MKRWQWHLAFLGTLLLIVAPPAVLNAASAKADSPQISEVSHSPQQPRGGEIVKITVKLATPDLKSVTLQYQVVDPGKYIALKDPDYKTKWVAVPMTASPRSGDAAAASVNNIYTAELPASLQTHRRLVRYRITAVDGQGHATTAPDAKDSQPNFAYFVYDGVPGWSGAIDPKSLNPKKRFAVNYGPEVMRRMQAYHLIAKNGDVEKATWLQRSQGKDYRYTGTLVFDGKVYDHVRFRARGGVWRHAMGKNMWKIDFNSGHHLEARDDYGRRYRTKWEELNLRACIQQGDYGHRGEQGMFESVGFRLFNLAGVEAPYTHWLQLRIISDAVEAPADQYHGDFWGLYLAIENEDGHFLKEHGLPDGNLYKMMGTGLLSHQGANAVTNRSDIREFMMSYRGRQSESWWRTNIDLPRYYSYRAIIEAIHHYDVVGGKNYDYYFNPQTKKWISIPWDIDLTWADEMYGDGGEPLRRPVLSNPAFRLEYQNRLREIRDLLFNTDQTYQVIDECAAIVAGPAGKPSIVEADRAKWDYHPIMASQYVMSEKAGQGLFYGASPSGDFAGMVQLMKNYVKKRSAFIDTALANDPSIPETPKVTSASPTGFPVNRLIFHCAEFNGNGQFAAMRWRLGEITDPKSPSFKPTEPRKYEITPVWESGELNTFQSDVTLPSNAAKGGHTYRVRACMKDNTGRWSHWSRPIEFVAGDAVK